MEGVGVGIALQPKGPRFEPGAGTSQFSPAGVPCIVRAAAVPVATAAAQWLAGPSASWGVGGRCVIAGWTSCTSGGGGALGSSRGPGGCTALGKVLGEPRLFSFVGSFAPRPLERDKRWGACSDLERGPPPTHTPFSRLSALAPSATRASFCLLPGSRLLQLAWGAQGGKRNRARHRFCVQRARCVEGARRPGAAW